MQLHHLALRTCDVERLVAFYRRVFDLLVVREGPHGSGRSVWLGLEHGVLMIEPAAEDEPLIDPRSLVFVAFRVDLARRAHIEARVTVEDRTEHTIYFPAPDGRHLAVATPPLL